MCTDMTNKTIKYSPEESVVKLKVGDEIKLTESAFVALSKRSLPNLKPNSCSHPGLVPLCKVSTATLFSDHEAGRTA